MLNLHCTKSECESDVCSSFLVDSWEIKLHIQIETKDIFAFAFAFAECKYTRSLRRRTREAESSSCRCRSTRRWCSVVRWHSDLSPSETSLHSIENIIRQFNYWYDLQIFYVAIDHYNLSNLRFTCLCYETFEESILKLRLNLEL